MENFVTITKCCRHQDKNYHFESEADPVDSPGVSGHFLNGNGNVILESVIISKGEIQFVL